MRLRDVLKTPIWTAALCTGAKSFAANPVIGSSRLNRYGLHAGRVRLAARMADARRSRLAAAVDAGDREAYVRDGFVLKENFLPTAVFEQLRREVFETEWPLREMRQGSAVTRRVPMDPTPLRHAAPGLANVVRDPALAALVRYVAGAGGQPIFSLQSVLAAPANSNPDPQSALHSDTFQSTAKAWLFMHDVGPEDGPFSYVPGSHRRTEARITWEKQQSIGAARHPVPYHARGSFRVTPDDLRQLGLPDPEVIPVKANTLVVADTSGFHARTPSTEPTCRVELFAMLRRNPFLPWAGLDPLSLPYLRGRSGSASIRVLEMLKQAGLAKMPWKPARQGRIDAPDRRAAER